jgi:hypothetical protein
MVKNTMKILLLIELEKNIWQITVCWNIWKYQWRKKDKQEKNLKVKIQKVIEELD